MFGDAPPFHAVYYRGNKQTINRKRESIDQLFLAEKLTSFDQDYFKIGELGGDVRNNFFHFGFIEADNTGAQ